MAAEGGMAEPVQHRLIAILAADAVGYSRLMAADDVATLAALDTARDVFRVRVEARAGRVVDTAGDSVLAAFPSAQAAVTAALDVQRELDAARTPLRFRVGVHLGEVIEKADGSLYGDGVNVAARLQALAAPGGVIVSQAVLDVIGARMPLPTTDLGPQTVKNIARPVHAHALGIGDAMPRAAAPDSGLPRQHTRFFGREREKSEAASLLREGGLLTLTGIGGSGKTRLAIEVATMRLAETGADVWFVDLAPVGDARDLAAAVCTVLGIRQHPEQDTLATISQRLHATHALLVLDNCEHLVDAAAELVENLLDACDGLSVLATSREPLGVPGEHVRPLRSLELAPSADIEALRRCDAVRLFTDRARLTAAGFAVDADNAAAVHEICQRLDGIPLALELAAARLNLLSPEQIRARLDDRFRLLTGGRRAVPRHQTLATVIRWSYDQLPPAEQRLLRRLSVCSGGWSLAVATALADAPEHEVLDMLAHLVAKSLIVVASGTGEARYTILETVRQYAQERLDEDAQPEDARASHLAFFARHAAALVEGEELRERWFARLAIDHENIVAALRFGAEGGKADDALRLAGALRRYWEASGHHELGMRLTEGVLAATAGAPPTPARLSALYAAGRVAVWTGRYNRQLALAEESVELARSLHRATDEFNALLQITSAALNLGDIERAERTAGEMERLATTLGAAQARTATHMKAEVLRTLGRLNEAEALYRANLDAAREQRLPRGIFADCINLALVALAQRDFEAGRSWMRECAAVLRDGDWGLEGWAHAIEVVAALQAGSGDSQAAARLHGAVRAFERRIGMRVEPIDEQTIVGLIDEARLALGAEAFDRAAAEGRALTVEAMFAEARAWLGVP
jgi:non-specific serine/threonine protein kinase